MNNPCADYLGKIGEFLMECPKCHRLYEGYITNAESFLGWAKQPRYCCVDCYYIVPFLCHDLDLACEGG